jgi:hypothetical protein
MVVAVPLLLCVDYNCNVKRPKYYEYKKVGNLEGKTMALWSVSPNVRNDFSKTDQKQQLDLSESGVEYAGWLLNLVIL